MDEVLVFILRELKENGVLIQHRDGNFYLAMKDPGPYGYVCELNSHQFNVLANTGWKID